MNYSEKKKREHGKIFCVVSVGAAQACEYVRGYLLLN